jgi:hypothetical protein
VLDAAAAAASVLLVANNADPVERVAAAALAVVAGTVIALIVLLTWRLVRSPFVQRDEARDALRAVRRADDDPDLSEFAAEFDEFVQAVNASMPTLSMNITLMFEDRAAAARSNEEYQRATDQARREALAQYQRRFQKRMLAVLARHGQSGFHDVHRATAAAPKGIGDLRTLEDALTRMIADVGPTLDERLHSADELQARFQSQGWGNSRQDYKHWRSTTEVLVAERSRTWATSFGPTPDLESITGAEELIALLAADQARLREFAAQAGESH